MIRHGCSPFDHGALSWRQLYPGMIFDQLGQPGEMFFMKLILYFELGLGSARWKTPALNSFHYIKY